MGSSAAKAQEKAQEGLSALSEKVAPGWKEIPAPGKSAQMGFGCCGGQSDDPAACPYIYTLKAELANSYYWSGNCGFDYFFFVCQWHPVIGMLLSHPNHPWSKKERFLMTVVSLCITMVPSAVIGKTFEDDAIGKKLMTILGVTLPDTIIGVILYQLSIAETRWFCALCAPLWRCIQGCLFCLALFFGALSTIICYMILSDTRSGTTHWDKMLEPLAWGIGVSYVTWFPLWLILPCQLGFLSLWCLEKKGYKPAIDIEDQGRKGGLE